MSRLTHSPTPLVVGASARRGAAAQGRQRGAATLLGVMVLLFVVSLVAAYTGRNMLFEQRTSANYQQSTVSFEAADAGLEWALAMLNSGRIDDTCASSTDPAQQTFRQRYLTADATDATGRNIWVRDEVRNGPVWPSCVSAGGGWQCSCPTATAPALVAPAANGLNPAFRIRLMPLNNPTPLRPGLVRIEVKGCTQLDDSCLNFPPANFNQCTGTVCATVALSPALKSAPVAAVTAKGGIDIGGFALTAINESSQFPVAVQAGGSVTGPNLDVRGRNNVSVSDMPSLLVANDTALSDPLFTADRMFAATFGTWREIYREQPGAVTVNCSPSCASSDVRSAADANPGRILLLNGNVELNGGGDIGSRASPVLLIVRGNLGFSAATTVYGVVYAETANWQMTGVPDARIVGGAIAEGDITSTSAGDLSVARDEEVLERLRWQTGSFVKVPGGWRDFQ